MKIVLILVLTFFGLKTFGQQPSPIGIIFNPRVNTFAISGVGGGNLYELTGQKSSTSGQVALDWNIALKDGKTSKTNKPKLTTLTTIFKYNPFLQANFVNGDSIEMRKVAFIDNEFQMLLGIRLNVLKSLGTDDNSKMINMLFFDGCMAPYKLENSINPLSTGFKNFNLNLGYQFGYLTNTDFGLVGFTISPQLNYIHIYEDQAGGTSFEELNKTTTSLSRNILGGGFKINIPLNDFCFFFEARKYFPLDNSVSISGLTDRAVFSFGGVATGTVFKAKTKESK
jgi:hypothetical protein